MFSTRSQLRMSILLFVLFIGFNQEVDAIPRHFLGRHLNGQLRRDFIFDQMLGIDSKQQRPDDYDDSTCNDDKSKKLTIGYFDQPLDHFAKEPEKSGKWQQHYQVNDKFYKKSDSPIVFLMIGGEGAMDNKWVCYENYTYMIAAKNYSAKVIQLEHRFFGHNKGLKDMSVDSLQYLTTEQALADINAFILGYNKAQNWTAPKWVAFGGSYPGTIAALLRLKYPGITQGAIASSAPLRPVVDFWEYAYVMERTIKDTSQECYDSVKVAFKQLLDYSLSASGRTKLNRQLKIQPPLSANPTKEDVDTVTSDVFGVFQGIIQYTFDARDPTTRNESGPHNNIFYVCQLMTSSKTKDPIDRLYSVYKFVAGDDNANVLGSYQDSISDLQNTTLLPTDAAEGRGWLWLSCNEFGWLQSTSNNGLFGDVVPLSLYIKTCSDLFSQTLNATQIYQRIKDTNDRYGSTDNYNATNVFLPNGLYDPWSALGVQDNKTLQAARESKHLITHFTPQAAHCSDMYAEYENEPTGLKETRKMFYKELDYYLSQDSVYKKNKDNDDKGKDGDKNKDKKNGASAILMTSLMFPFVLAHLWLN